MIIILWEDSKTGLTRYEKFHMTAEQAASEWQNNHPTETALYQFLAEDDLLSGDGRRRREFIANCAQYGLSPTDYNRKLCLIDGGEGILKGIELGRRKYVFRVWKCADQKYILYSVKALQQGLQKYAELHP